MVWQPIPVRSTTSLPPEGGACAYTYDRGHESWLRNLHARHVRDPNELTGSFACDHRVGKT